MANVRITGIEATQAIQIYKSQFPLCTAGAMKVPCPDNSVPLVAGKPTAIRVYVTIEGARERGPGAGQVTGFAWIPDANFDPARDRDPYWLLGVETIDMSIPKQRVRLRADKTLNFLIPADRARSTLTVLVMAYDNTPGRAGTRDPVGAGIALTFHERGLIRVRLARIRYTGKGMNVPAPSLADFWASAAQTETLLPAPSPCFLVMRDSEEEYDGDFSDVTPAGSIPGTPNWGTTGSLLNILDRLAGTETLPGYVLYLAIYNDWPGVRKAGQPGWSVNGRAIVRPADPYVLAHEVGHWLHRDHVDCGAPANPDPNYPDYQPFPTGSIGEVGFDPLAGVTKDPASTFDLMGYCQPVWVSPYGWTFAFDYNAPQPPLPEHFFGPNRYLTLGLDLVRLPRRTSADWPAFVLAGDAPGRREAGSVQAALLDAAGAVLSSATFEAGPSCSAPGLKRALAVAVRLAWHEAAARVRVWSGGAIWLERAIEATAPRVRARFELPSRRAPGRARVRWTSHSKHGPCEARLRFSPDGGILWQAVALPRGATRCDVLLERFPGGERCLLELAVSAGVRTATVRSRPFRSAGRPALPLIVQPADGDELPAGAPVVLRGVTTRDAAATVRLTWHSSRDGSLGSGSIVKSRPLSPGAHTIELRDGDCAGAASRIHVQVRARKRAPR